MPVEITKRDDKYCVVDSAGKTHGCHSSQDDAVGQMLAINASMEKTSVFPVLDMLRSLVNKKRSDLLLHKGTDGLMHWSAVYSNSFRDDDYPVREALSAESHRLFEVLVDEGAVPYPQLWVYHEKSWNLGQSTWVATWENPQDESVVFALAGGYIHPGLEDVAESIMSMPSVKVSHGMYRDYVIRDMDDPSIIRFYISKEFSVVPGGLEANHLTGFFLDEDDTMSEDFAKKRKALEGRGVPGEMLDKLQSLTDTLSEAGVALEFESVKTAGETEDADAAADNVTQTDQETESQDTTADVDGQEPVEGDAADQDGVTDEGTQEVMTELAKAVEISLNAAMVLNEKVNGLQETLQTLEKSVRDLRKSDDEKVAEKAKMTPMASMAALVNASVVGKDGAREDGRSSLAKSGPTETQGGESVRGRTPFPLVNQWMAGGNGNGGNNE